MNISQILAAVYRTWLLPFLVQHKKVHSEATRDPAKVAGLATILVTNTSSEGGVKSLKGISAACRYHSAVAEASQGAATSQIISAAFIE